MSRQRSGRRRAWWLAVGGTRTAEREHRPAHRDRVSRSDRRHPPAAPVNDSVTIRFLGHATVLLELPGVRILTDPFLRHRLGPLRRHGPVPSPADLGPI